MVLKERTQCKIIVSIIAVIIIIIRTDAIMNIRAHKLLCVFVTVTLGSILKVEWLWVFFFLTFKKYQKHTKFYILKSNKLVLSVKLVPLPTWT